MNPEVTVLLFTAVSIGFLHTITGPDHYLPFIVMGKARSWTMTKTLWITFLCGLGHVGSSILIGIVGIILGIQLHHLVLFESLRGNFAAWAFIIFGLLYFLWGLRKAHHNHVHNHLHFHTNGSLHVHEHQHIQNVTHSHEHTEENINLTPWILFTIFVLGPCEPLIPLLMYPAAKAQISAVVWVALLFSIITIATMLVSVFLASSGIRMVSTRWMEKYMHAIAGATICISGCAIVFLGL